MSVKDLMLNHMYDVLCVQYQGVDVPVLGDAHQDEGQSNIHFHVDFRFITIEESMAAFGVDVVEQYQHKCTLLVLIPVKKTDGTLIPLSTPQIKTRKCLRPWPVNITNTGVILTKSAHFIQRDMQQWIGQKLDCMKCPHRGTDLTNAPVINGKIYCPAHGLKFNVNTLKCIP